MLAVSAVGSKQSNSSWRKNEKVGGEVFTAQPIRISDYHVKESNKWRLSDIHLLVTIACRYQTVRFMLMLKKASCEHSLVR